MSSESEYQEPPWAKAPSGVWSLREIKGGVQIAQHVLDRSTVLLGRAADQVHIVLQHESSSRQHARIAFDASGTPWLRDLSSSHGTTVNRKRPPPAAVGRSESLSRKAGSRGVTLYPGDVLQFGASTRMFCLKGPTEFERGAVSAKAAAAAATTMLHSESVDSTTFHHNNNNTNKQAVDNNHNEPEGISWGIDMGDHETESNNEASLKLPLDIEDQLDDKHRKEFERLRALKYKLENLQTESDRIRRKGELSEGQERQLQRNEEREGKFREEIEEKETELHRKVFPGKRKTGHASSRGEKESYGREDDVDDFYDRTKDKASDQGIGEGETEQSLTSKWKADRDLIEAARVELEDAKLKAFKIERRLETLQDTGDEEAFFVQNDLDLAKETIEKIKHETTRLQKEKEESKRLLKIVNPKLKIDESTGNIASEGATDGFAMPPPTMKAPATMQPPSSDSDSFMPPPKRMRGGPDDPEHISPGPSFQPPSEEKSKLKTAPGSPPKGTLSIFFSETSGPAASGKHTVPVSRKDTKEKETNFTVPDSRKETKEEQPATSSDPQVDVWQAPKDQDGSGITKLNAKFAGRY
jgi:pSer/pThr/pTyr-binding forkhead associated (FHA) protein